MAPPTAFATTMATTFVLSYSCELCKATSVATVIGLTPPSELRDEKRVETLRRAHEARKELAEKIAVPTAADEDPVENLDLAILSNQSKYLLTYATCPACNGKNPSGIAAAKRERIVARVASVGFFGLVALCAFWVPSVAYVMPLFAFVLSIAAIVAARRSGQPVRVGPLVLQHCFRRRPHDVRHCSSALCLHCASAPSSWLLFARGSTVDERFVRAAAKIRFERSPYRGPGV